MTPTLQNNLKVLFIDWNGTLSNSKFWGHLENSTTEGSKLFSRIQASLFAGNLRTLLNPWMKGELNSEQVIRSLSEELLISEQILFEELVTSCKQMQFVSPEVTDLIQEVRAKDVQVVIATDNMDSFPRWTVPALKLTQYFDDVLDSHTLRAMKSDVDDKGNDLFFGEYLSKNEVGHNEGILIDDSEDRNDKIANKGIIYRKIEPGVGLIPELRNILRDLRR